MEISKGGDPRFEKIVASLAPKDAAPQTKGNVGVEKRIHASIRALYEMQPRGEGWLTSGTSRSQIGKAI
jgi:hypothetical protein